MPSDSPTDPAIDLRLRMASKDARPAAKLIAFLDGDGRIISFRFDAINPQRPESVEAAAKSAYAVGLQQRPRTTDH